MRKADAFRLVSDGCHGVRRDDRVAVAGLSASSVAAMFSIESSRGPAKVVGHEGLEEARKL